MTHQMARALAKKVGLQIGRLYTEERGGHVLELQARFTAQARVSVWGADVIIHLYERNETLKQALINYLATKGFRIAEVWDNGK